MKKLLTDIRAWIKRNPKQTIILFIILGLAAFLRLFRIAEYMTFLGDEGRDALIVSRFVTKGDIMLIGPGTSIGNMYLGPLYYYLISPALLLSGISPIGPSIFVALIGVVTVFMVWYIGKEWFSNLAGFFAAFLYAISPTVIIYSRSSWNPNVMPFFALLAVYSFWKAWKQNKYFWLLIGSISYAFVLQSHYLGLVLGPVLAILWLMGIVNKRKDKRQSSFIKYSIIGLITFILLMSPLAIFDARHGGQNFEAIKTFFTVRQTTVSARPWTSIPKMWPLFTLINTRLLAGQNEMVGTWISVILLGLIIFYLYKDLKETGFKNFLSNPIYLVLFWYLIALVGFGIYKQHIYDHYFGFLFPVPFLLLAGLLTKIDRKIISNSAIVLILGILAFVNMNNSPLRYPPNRQLQRTRQVAEFIRDRVGSEKFNLAVIAERNYEDAYQFFLEKWDTGVTDIDPLNSEATITDQLFVVCEKVPEECQPVSNPKTEVANFGWSKIEDQWQIAGVTVYRLVHTQ